MDTRHGIFYDMVPFPGRSDASNAVSLTMKPEPRIKLGVPIAGKHEP